MAINNRKLSIIKEKKRNAQFAEKIIKFNIKQILLCISAFFYDLISHNNFIGVQYYSSF